jgi:hypothetical protein
MASVSTISLSTSASLVVNYTSTASLNYNNITIPFTNSTIGRVVYIKQANEAPAPSVMSITPQSGTFVQGSTLLYLSSCQCLMLQAFSTNNWAILGAYNGLNVFSTQLSPVNSVVVNPSMKVSNIFVDVTTQSKCVVLPLIDTLVASESTCPFYTIKDINGNSETSTIFISSSGGDTFENSTIKNALRLETNYASIDLAANPLQNKWHILNYYNGSLS